MGEKFMWVTSLARNAVVVIFGIILNRSLFSYGIKIFKSTGNITEGLPPFAPPPFSLTKGNHTYHFQELIGELGSTVISVPLIAILEHCYCQSVWYVCSNNLIPPKELCFLNFF